MFFCNVCGNNTKHYGKGMCHKCYDLKWQEFGSPERQQRTQKRANAFALACERCKLGVVDAKTLRAKSTCTLLKLHHEDLKDDPESLSLEFLQQIIGIKCDKQEKV